MTASTADPYLVLRETHCAGLLLVGDRALKFKKPVDLGFLDFTTREKRTEACHREVRLNRRFSPDVYLGVAELELPDGTREPIVAMRRMPEDRRLSVLVDRGVDVGDSLRQLARQLAVAHAAGERRADIDTEASAARLTERWQQSLDQVRAQQPSLVDPATLDEVERLVHRFIEGRQLLLDLRVRDGCAVDGHGDLIADDVFCLDDGPRALDCLEFDDRLRYLDRLDDACFLAMDLERLRAPDRARDFLAWYAEFSGDHAPPALAHHYLAYRAFVRAKVACLRGAQGVDVGAELAGYLQLTVEHLRAGAVRLVLVGGPPGSGKTTLATNLADRLGAVDVSSDRVRKELAGLDPTTSAADAFGEGIYAPEHSERTYRELLHRAEVLLSRGESVVLDATWSRRDQRLAALLVAQARRADLVQLRCDTSAAAALERVAARAGAAGVVSDADVTVAERLRESADSWPEAQAVDTSTTVVRSVDRAVELVLPAGSATTVSPRRRSFETPE